MPPPWHIETDLVRIRKICVGGFENNSYVVASTTSPSAILVDAAAEPERLLAACGDVSVTAILTTHGHFDHVGAVPTLRGRLGPFRLHPADAALAGIDPDLPLDVEAISIGSTSVDVLHTPGHTPGSVCLLVDGILLSGDTLFPGGPGATRGAESDFATIMRSLESVVFALADDTLVLPGHGLDTTIGAERPHLAAWRARGW